MKKSNYEEICRKYVKEMSISQAIPRVNEFIILTQFDFESPILDLGCGEGVFAGAFLGKRKIDVGLDINKKSANLAVESGVYQKVVIAPANKIPYPDNYFKTVISNSVLEHIEDLKAVFKEVYRVLKKGGKFIFIVPDKSASEHLFYAELLEKIKLTVLATAYIKFKNRLYRYAHLEDKKFWEETSRTGGFRINKVVGLISPKTVRVIDFFSPFALPDYVLRRIFGHSFIYRPNFLAKIITPYILRHMGPVKESEATGWCFELEKKS